MGRRGSRASGRLLPARRVVRVPARYSKLSPRAAGRARLAPGSGTRMLTLFHHPFCPHSRFVRLALGEFGLAARLIEERVWERREEFLILNPAGTTPVLLAEGQPPVPGAGIIAEFLDETIGSELGDRRLLPPDPGPRVEVRRLMSWFNDKFFDEVSGPLTTERLYKRRMPTERRRRIAQYRGDPRGPPQHPLSSGLYRLAGAHARLARRRPHDLCGSGGGGACVGGRLHGRCAVEGRRSRKGLVRADQVAAHVPAAADRDAGRDTAVGDLRGSGLLADAAAHQGGAHPRRRAGRASTSSA